MADMINFKRVRVPVDVILVCIRCYAACPPSDRHIEDHSTIKRWKT
jgi:hypothetical protein